jgi:hypothetical protein
MTLNIGSAAEKSVHQECCLGGDSSVGGIAADWLFALFAPSVDPRFRLALASSIHAPLTRLLKVTGWKPGRSCDLVTKDITRVCLT